MGMMSAAWATTTAHQSVSAQELLCGAAMQSLPKFLKASHQKLRNYIWMSMKSLQ